MSMTRLHLWLAAFSVVVSLASTASAQHLQPFIEPDSFDPDLQFFAPAEVSTFGGGEPPNVGFYAAYDSLYLNVNRPDGAASFQSPFDGDMGGGNRYELGYMTDEDTGWQIGHMHMNGPGEFSNFAQERLNRFEDLDIPPDSFFPISDRNMRRYQIKNSINALTFSNNEINKIWRRPEFHNGAILETLVGVRYMSFEDYFRRTNYTRPFVNQEIIDRLKTFTENNMLGGQLGFRLSNTYGHWNLSGEFKAFALQNYQMRTTTLSTVTTNYNIANTIVVNEQKALSLNHGNNEEFVWGGEFRGEAAYELTRDISLRAGFMILNMAQGIGRGGSSTVMTNQDVFMGGVSFGLTVNR